jgi:aspartate-semialdehyde dehydrogenase
MRKIRAGVLGATGTVGQQLVRYLQGHPWFELTALAASGRSEGKTYAEACRWLLSADMPANAADLRVESCEPGLDCEVLFSGLPSDVAGPVELAFAQAGYAVSSNAAAHRMAADVPLLIPEVNANHVALVERQRQARGWGKGCIVTNPNCSSTQLALALKPLHDAFGLRRVSVTTLQALSGAGYPGVPSLEALDNVIPFIGGEEEKLEAEPCKLLGQLEGDEVRPAPIAFSAQCHRVGVRDGHMEAVSVEFHRAGVTPLEVAAALESFCGEVAGMGLPSAPERPIRVRTEQDRPQPVLDRDEGGGMTVVVGRIRPCPVLGMKFELLGHNTVRGAAGAAIMNAELLVARGYLEN